MHESFLSLLASELDTSPRKVSQALEEMRRDVIEEASAQGEARIEGLGVFTIVEGNLVFDPDEALVDAINHRYAHLDALEVRREIPSFLLPEVEEAPETEDVMPHSDDEASWSESLDKNETDPLGVGSPYEDADFDVVDDEDRAVDKIPDGANDPDLASHEEETDVEEPQEETAADVSANEDDTGQKPDSPVDEPTFDETLETESHQGEPIPVAHAATQETLPDKEKRRRVEVEQSSRELILPNSPIPYYSVLRREELVDSSFIGAKLENYHVEPAPDSGRTTAKTEAAPDREPVSSRDQSTGSLSWKNTIVVTGLAVFLLVGGWLLAEQTGLIDQVTGGTGDTEKLFADTDEDEDGALTEEEEPPVSEEEFQEPDQPDAPDEPAGPPPIEATAGMWTIVMASETNQDDAEERLDELWPQLEATDLPADVISSEMDGVTRYRVALGSFESQDQATEYLNSLSDQLPEGSWLLQFDEDI